MDCYSASPVSVLVSGVQQTQWLFVDNVSPCATTRHVTRSCVLGVKGACTLGGSCSHHLTVRRIRQMCLPVMRSAPWNLQSELEKEEGFLLPLNLGALNVKKRASPMTLARMVTNS